MYFPRENGSCVDIYCSKVNILEHCVIVNLIVLPVFLLSNIGVLFFLTSQFFLLLFRVHFLREINSVGVVGFLRHVPSG